MASRSRVVLRRRAALGLVVLLVLTTIALVVSRDGERILRPDEVRGSPAWAQKHYGDPDAKRYKKRNIVQIDFLGRAMFVHRDAAPHFLRLERLFEARAPEYAAGVVLGELDDWSYLNRNVRGGDSKSNHAFGLAIDVNALTNVQGTAGDMPEEVVAQWLIEGGEWGGNFSNPDPMHFETHLTPGEIRKRYHSDGTPTEQYLEELIG